MYRDKGVMIAEEIRSVIRPFCERSEIAGSIRRLNKDVKDVEIVAEPKVLAIGGVDTFDFSQLGIVEKNGPRYKRILYKTQKDLVPVDLFFVRPPAQWGVIFMIRTGPAAFSKLMVTQKHKGGFLPNNCRVKDGQFLRDGEPVIVDSEHTLFALMEMEYIPPWHRAGTAEDKLIADFGYDP